MYCENCGKKLSDDAKNCDNCGYKVVSSAVSDESKPQQKQQPQPQYRTNNTQQNSVPPSVNYQNQQQSYYNPSQQPYNPQYNPDNNAPMTVGGYLLTFILLAIPIVGIIMIFVWAFGDNVNLNKKNLAKAYLILMIIGIVLSILFFILFYSFFSTFNSVYTY